MVSVTENLANRLHTLIARTHFPRVGDAEGMLRWIGLMRILVGLIALYRTGLIAESSRFYYGNPAEWTDLVNTHATELALVQMMLLGLFTVGLFTPVVTIALIASYPQMDLVLGTGTLGSHVFSTLLIFFFIVGAGSRVSLDALLGRRVRWLYVLGEPGARQLTIYLFLLFASYALLSFGALMHHVADAYWQDGDTVGVLMTSSYLSRVWEPAREIQEFWPWGFNTFSEISVLGQTIFQLTMLVLIRWRWGMVFVVAWGGMFILISVAVIQLSYLPFLEVALWGLLWVRPRLRAAAVTETAPDTTGRVRRVLRAINPARGLAFRGGRATEPPGGAEVPPRRRAVPAAPQRALVPVAMTAAVLAMSLLTAMTFDTWQGFWKSIGVRPWSTTFEAKVGEWRRYAGFIPPNVFNEADLRMGEQWWTATYRGPDGQTGTVPFQGVDGSRRSYHRADPLYFGNGLRWRRGTIDQDLAALHGPEGDARKTIGLVLRYHRRRQGGPGPWRYTVRLYGDRSANVRLPLDDRYRVRRAYTYLDVLD